MNDIIEHLSSQIHKTVFNWTSKFSYHIDFIRQVGNKYEFAVEFSLPTKLNPIPKANVKVFFTCEELGDGEFDFTYRFENQSLVHRVTNTIRSTQIEKWIERVLKEKELTRDVLFLGTQFEAERIKSDKIDQIFKEAVLNPVTKELRRLNESLLSSSIDYTRSESSIDEKTLELLKNTMFDFFRGVDKNDLGVVSYKECSEILKAMEIEITDYELNDLLQIADKNQNGVIEYREFVPIGAEIMYGLLIKQQTEKDLNLEEEMVINQAIMILYNDEVHDISNIIVKDCQEIDEDHYGVIPTEKIKEVLRQHSGVLSERELDILYEQIQEQYPGNFPYKEIPNMLFKFKVDIVKHGLAENNVTVLEQYLRKLFEIFDTHKNGKITQEALMEALTKADKIVLTQIQLYILRNYVKKEEDGNINYLKESKFLAEMIKKFFNPSVLKKQAQFVENGAISSDTYMQGWTREALLDQMNEIFEKYDVDRNKLLDKKEYKSLLAQMGINLTEDEADAMIKEADKNDDGFVDFTEFQSHFFTVLKLIRRSKALYAISEIA